jgi:N-acetylmuramoyl-L-alanine amidase
MKTFRWPIATYVLLAAGVGWSCANLIAAETTRQMPRRPMSGLAVTRIGGVDYVDVADVGTKFGLKIAWVKPGKKVVLHDEGVRAELDNDGRGAVINGLRVFLGDPALSQSGRLFVSRIDYERLLTPLLRPRVTIIVPALPKVIAIDPGHGGIDQGAENKKVGVVEKQLTLDVALRLKLLLEKNGYRVVMTRTEDVLLAPKPRDMILRATIANGERADLFVSIHFNAVTKDPQRTRGVEVYTFPPATQHAADWWGDQKNKDPYLLTSQEPGNKNDHWNAVFAQAVHRQLLQGLKTEDRGQKSMHLGVLRLLNCPGVLVEPAMIANDEEAKKLTSPAYRQQIAESLAAGVEDYSSLLKSFGAEDSKEEIRTSKIGGGAK